MKRKKNSDLYMRRKMYDRKRGRPDFERKGNRHSSLDEKETGEQEMTTDRKNKLHVLFVKEPLVSSPPICMTCAAWPACTRVCLP